MTCEHNWSRAGNRWATYDTCFWICVAAVDFDVVAFGKCRRLGAGSHRHCLARPATCATAFPASPAARRWADCDDVATLRKRGEAYEHAWAKSAARELDLMIEIERLKREVAAMKGDGQ